MRLLVPLLALLLPATALGEPGPFVLVPGADVGSDGSAHVYYHKCYVLGPPEPCLPPAPST